MLARDRGDAAGEAADGGPGIGEDALERCDAAGEREERAGEVILFVGRIDGERGLRGERAQREIVEDQAARQG